MALTGLRTNYAWGSTYEEGRNYFIKLVEEMGSECIYRR